MSRGVCENVFSSSCKCHVLQPQIELQTFTVFPVGVHIEISTHFSVWRWCCFPFFLTCLLAKSHRWCDDAVLVFTQAHFLGMSKKEAKCLPGSTLEKSKHNPSPMKAIIWTYFGIHSLEGNNALDKTDAICKLCKGKVKYFGNTTNLRTHVIRHHPETDLEQLPVAPSQQNNALCNNIENFQSTWSGQKKKYPCPISIPAALLIMKALSTWGKNWAEIYYIFTEKVVPQLY